MFTVSDQGISTSRDVSTGNSTTNVTYDGLVECKYSLKGQYVGRSTWIFHRDALKKIEKLKDGDGHPMLKQAAGPDDPPMLLSRPVLISESVPNTFATGLYVGILGDFSHYFVGESLKLVIQRLDELFAEQDEVGLIARLELDGMPVLAEAFARVTLA